MKYSIYVLSYIIGAFMLLFINSSTAQSLLVTNVHYRKLDNKIEIFYDLPHNRDTLIINVMFYKKSDSTFKYHPKHLTGDISVGIFSGKNKKIVWNIKNEPPSLFTGSGFYFIVKAKRFSSKIAN